jgi:signal transduction histidine kinase
MYTGNGPAIFMKGTDMGDSEAQTYSISRGARVQFAIGVALISIIPLLVFWYFNIAGEYGEPASGFQNLIVLMLLTAAAVGGYTILQKYPLNIVRLRGYLERVIGGELPEQVHLLKAEDDVAAIEHCLNLIIAQLKERLDLLQQEKKSLQQQLYQAQKMESMGLMAAGAAHDFNNLLTSIMGSISLLSDHLPRKPDALSLVQDMELAVQRAADLTNQMLIYSGRGKFAMEDVNMSSLIKEMQPLLKTSVGRGVELRYRLSENLPWVKADPTQKRQVIMNLVINASDAIGSRGGVITITTREIDCAADDFAQAMINGKLPEGRCVCLEVSDTGCGMEPEKAARVFDPFFTTKPKGRGLGLAVVLGIVVAHKGAIAIESEPGKGTRFLNLIPCGEQAEES